MLSLALSSFCGPSCFFLAEVFVPANPGKAGTEMVLCCIVFSLYSSWTLLFLTNHSNFKGCQASKPKAALGYLSHLLVWHIVLDAVAAMEVAVKVSLENVRKMKSCAQEHKNCCSPGWISCQPQEYAVGDIKRHVRLSVSVQTTKFLLHFHFAEIKIHPDVVHWKLQISVENLDRQCPIYFFLAKSIHEWKMIIAMDLCIGFTCFLMIPGELSVFDRLREVWWAEG